VRSKLLSFDQASAVCDHLRASGKRIVQCHGTFDVVHPGHIVYFEEARSRGDALIVTVTGESHVNDGPGRPYLNDQMRLKWLSALECVDFVVIVPSTAAVPGIECVRPDVYCIGHEEAGNSHAASRVLQDDVLAVRRCGGEVAFLGLGTADSTRFLNRYFDTHTREVKDFCRQVAALCPLPEFRRVLDDFANLRVLIVGDIIFDRYTTVEVQGLTSKNRILSCRFIAEEMQAGGALAVYRHVREFTPHVKLISLAGNELWLEEVLRRFVVPTEEAIVRSPHFTTIVKQRFVEPRSEGKELSKLFSVNYIEKHPPDDELQRAVLERIAGHIDDHDVVLAMDFGHGLFEDKVRNYVQEKARFIAVNCQTNSNNHGFNILNRRYRRADCFTLDHMEITLAVGHREFDYRCELAKLGTALGSRYAWLTRGSVETLGWQPPDRISACAPFERNVVDTLGAGDAFFAVATLAAASQAPLALATFMGQLAGALAVKIVGNAEPIRKWRFLKGAEVMLSL